MAETGSHHRRRRRPLPRAHRHPRTASDAAVLRAADVRHVPQRRDRLRRRQPALVRPRVRREDPLGGRRSRRRSLVGGDTLIGEDEVTEVAAEHRDLMKGDPLRGVHAFYAASAREWWAPLYPLRRVFRRNALVAALDKPSEFAGRAIHEWTAQVFRDDDGHAARRASTG